MAGAAQLAALLHSCSVPLHVHSPVHVGGVVQHASSSSLGVVAQHEAGAQGFPAVDEQGCGGWGLLQQGVGVGGGKDGLVVGAQSVEGCYLTWKQNSAG